MWDDLLRGQRHRSGVSPMSLRLIALDEGPDISIDRAMVIVGRHPQCDARLDSIRISRRHCCMTPEGSELLVRDLGSTNGIRINGHRVEEGRIGIGDELSIAHFRFRLEHSMAEERTLAATVGANAAQQAWHASGREHPNFGLGFPIQTPPRPMSTDEDPAVQEVVDPLDAPSPEHGGRKIAVHVHRRTSSRDPAAVVALPEPLADPCPRDLPR